MIAGIATGAEIGLYYRQWFNIPGWFACVDRSASSQEMLTMSFALYHYGSQVFYRNPIKQWWLTGFRTDYYSSPSNLSLYGSIYFINSSMATLFKNGFGSGAYQYGSEVDFYW